MKYLSLVLMLLLMACGNAGSGSGAASGSNVTVVQSVPCSVTQDSTGATISCPDGSKASVPKGQEGTPGASGPTGPQGAPGQDGTPVVPIKLCADYTTVYPNSFPEYAFCIGGDLFAVYWNGSQAFEAEIVPGDYISTSPQGCSFRVGPNCTVSPL